MRRSSVTPLCLERARAGSGNDLPLQGRVPRDHRQVIRTPPDHGTGIRIGQA
jgi:hypothetical protein